MTRTYDSAVNSRVLYRLSYGGLFLFSYLSFLFLLSLHVPSKLHTHNIHFLLPAVDRFQVKPSTD